MTAYLPELLRGLLVTCELSIVGFAGALVVGSVVAVFRVSPVPPLRVVGALWVGVLRNVPLLVLLVLFVFGLPDVGLRFSLFWTAATCLTLYASAFVCETVRSGIQTVPKGQAEAARALGLGFAASLRHVILPQALRVMVQPLGNVFIGVVLGTSLVAAVGVADLTNKTESLDLQYNEPLTTFGLAAAFYVAITLGGGLLFGVLERRLRVSR